MSNTNKPARTVRNATTSKPLVSQADVRSLLSRSMYYGVLRTSRIPVSFDLRGSGLPRLGGR
jgi:hypothetical protein